MLPVSYAGCFGWLHGAEPHGWSGASGDVGVVLCSSLANEAGCGYLTLRLLAESLAAEGYPVLRFDYPGTGNSSEIAADDAVPAWKTSLHASMDELRRLTGVRKIVLGGLRLGALLAASAAHRRDDVVALLLLAPVISGKHYVRELRAAAMVVWNAPPQRAGCLETDGMLFTDATLAHLSAMDLRTSQPSSARPILIAIQPGNKMAADYANSRREEGDHVQTIAFDGYQAMLRPSQGNEVPSHVLDRVRRWLLAAIPSNAARLEPRKFSAPFLFGPGWQEETLRFGPAQRLFGIICRPETVQKTACGNPIFVIGNTGIDPNHGYARFHVELARRMAQAGIASLRFDFPGLGDSAAGPDRSYPSHCYATDRRFDIAAALNALTRLGYNKIALGGICSGAYHAFQAALTDTRIAGLALVNLETLVWKQAALALPPEQTSRRSTRFYLDALRSGVAWQRLRDGNLKPAAIGMTMVRRLLHRARTAAGRLVERLGIQTAAAAPVRGLRALSRRGVPVLFLMGFEEPGLDTLNAHFGNGADRIAAQPGATLEIDPDIDHALSRAAMRAKVADRLIAFVQQKLVAPSEHSQPRAGPPRRNDALASSAALRSSH